MRISLEKTTNVMMIVSSVAVVTMCAFIVIRPRDQRPVRAEQKVLVEPANTTISLDTLASAGNPDAKIGLVEFVDFECAYCVDFARDLFSRFKSEFVDPGSVRFYWAHSPGEAIHKKAFRAAEAALCADLQDKSLQMFTRLFEAPARLDAADLFDHASAIGLEGRLFKSCMDQGKADVVRRHIERGINAGVRGTPTFFLGTIDPDGTLTAAQKISGLPAYVGLSNLVKHHMSQKQ